MSRNDWFEKHNIKREYHNDYIDCSLDSRSTIPTIIFRVRRFNGRIRCEARCLRVSRFIDFGVPVRKPDFTAKYPPFYTMASFAQSLRALRVSS
jgi:hypothetical protein